MRASTVGSVLVIGGGIGGIQCALDLAETGFFVYLMERSHSLGGTMARLDKTFPTNDCSTCMFSPKLVQAAANPNIEILTLSRLKSIEGSTGDFTARIEKLPRYIDADKCIACGQCAEKCPKKVKDAFNENLNTRKAAFLTFPQAVPLKYAIDPEHCIYLNKGKCGVCKKICPADAVAFDQKPQQFDVRVGAVVLSTGFEPALTEKQGEYGYGRYQNVVTSLQFERLLSATGPFAGHLRRPSDRRTPEKIAWIQCVLSRDAARNRPFCSSVCCMHAAKQAVMTKSHAPETQTTIYFLDIRAHGKGFDDYIDRARSQHGVTFKRSLISQVYLNPQNDNLVIETFDHHLNQKIEEEYDMVVLSSGLQPATDFSKTARVLDIAVGRYGFLPTHFDTPVSTSRPGVFVCGGIEAPKDIPETVIQAGAAAAESAVLLASARNSNLIAAETTRERDLPSAPRIGVFVCHCGTNIGGVVNIQEIVDYAKTLPHVVLATDFIFTCSTETQETLIQTIQAQGLNRVVVAACSPKTHEPLFQETLRKAGVNPYLFELAGIREQCAWVHGKTPQAATEKSKDIIRASVARAAKLEPLYEHAYSVTQEALIIGGGVSGMSAALAVADQGFKAHLVEQSPELGGFAANLVTTLEGHSVSRLARYLTERVRRHPNIAVHLNSRLAEHKGHRGKFSGVLLSNGERVPMSYGAVVVATGGSAYEPDEYLYGSNKRVMTQVSFAQAMAKNPAWASGLGSVVMIQCVGSRNETFPFCSRVCCAAAVKNSLALKSLNPEARIVVLYRDMRTFGFKELHYLKARQSGVLFFRYVPDKRPQVHESDGKLTVDFTDRNSHQPFRVHPELVVLSAGIRPHEEAGQVAKLLKLPRTGEGFFQEAHVKLRPVEFASQGIFLAGLAHSPRFIEESITMAKSAAQQAVKILEKKELTTSAAVATVDPDRCAACLACVRVCPYGAPFINADGVSEIPPSSCMGCGICAGECPAQAISLNHSTDDQILAKIDGLLEAASGNGSL
jgi:heterodisulfide reductase subunit A